MADKKNKIEDKKLKALREEIVMAEKLNEEELEPILNEAIARYTGKHIPHFGYGWDIILNEVYPIIQNELPSIFFRNPKVFLKPRNKTFLKKQRDPITGTLETIQADSNKSAQTQEAILNYSMSEIKYKDETRKVLLDALLFPYGVMWHGYKGDFGMTDEASMVIRKDKTFVKRINPMSFIKDPMVNLSDIDEARWVGRSIMVPLEDILEDDQLDVDKKEMKGIHGFGNLVGTKTFLKNGGQDTSQPSDIKKKSLLDSTSDSFKDSDASKFVKVHEIFLRPNKKERKEGKKGWIILLTDQQKRPLRISEWTIKAEGFPPKILQFNQLNDNMIPMADIDAYKQIVDQKNVITNLQIRNAQELTKTWIGISKEGADEEDVEAIKQGTNSIILFEDGKPSERMYVASPGSSSNELYLFTQQIQRNLEDKSGITDLKRGFLQSGEESATSVKLRAAGGGARPAYRQDIMADFLRESVHYLNQLNKQFMPFKDAVRIMGTLDIEWTDNYTKEDLQADTDVEINVISMLPENPQEELQSLQQTLLLAVQSLESPVIRQKLTEEGRTISLTPLIEQILLRQRINDPNIFRSIQPEESMGFVSVQQLREAQANIEASLTNQQIPFPPTENDDHVAKLETYGAFNKVLEAMGQVSDQLNALIQVQQQLLAAEQEKQEKPGQRVRLSKGKVASV